MWESREKLPKKSGKKSATSLSQGRRNTLTNGGPQRRSVKKLRQRWLKKNFQQNTPRELTRRVRKLVWEEALLATIKEKTKEFGRRTRGGRQCFPSAKGSHKKKGTRKMPIIKGTCFQVRIKKKARLYRENQEAYKQGRRTQGRGIKIPQQGNI